MPVLSFYLGRKRVIPVPVQWVWQFISNNSWHLLDTQSQRQVKRDTMLEVIRSRDTGHGWGRVGVKLLKWQWWWLQKLISLSLLMSLAFYFLPRCLFLPPPPLPPHPCSLAEELVSFKKWTVMWMVINIEWVFLTNFNAFNLPTF